MNSCVLCEVQCTAKGFAKREMPTVAVKNYHRFYSFYKRYSGSSNLISGFHQKTTYSRNTATIKRNIPTSATGRV